MLPACARLGRDHNADAAEASPALPVVCRAGRVELKPNMGVARVLKPRQFAHAREIASKPTSGICNAEFLAPE